MNTNESSTTLIKLDLGVRDEISSKFVINVAVFYLEYKLP